MDLPPVAKAFDQYSPTFGFRARGLGVRGLGFRVKGLGFGRENALVGQRPPSGGFRAFRG